MNFKAIYIVVLSLVFFCSCSNQNKDKFWFLQKDQDYSRVKVIFNDYIDFFPQNTSNIICVNDTWSLDKSDEYNVKAVFRFLDGSMQDTLIKIEKSAIAKYTSNQKCLLVLNRFATHTNYGYPKEHEINKHLINLDCYNDLYPIPNFSNFSEYQSNETLCKLKSDFTIYVLDAQSGKFLDDDLLTDGKYMPEKWRNGYSKGVAISEEKGVIIYWVIIW